MKKLINILFSGMLLISISPMMSYSQFNWDKWEDQYWVSRDMLVNDYMVIGDCKGCGIILNTRGKCNFDEAGNWNWDEDLLGSIAVYDEPFNLGIYMGIIATEWKLRHDAGVGTTDVEQELFYAIKTLERLDKNAEFYWRKYYGPSTGALNFGSDLNGFLIADDIFDDFVCFDCDHNSQGYKNFMSLNSNYYDNKDTDNPIAFQTGVYSGMSTLPYDRNSKTYMKLSEYNTRALQKAWDYPDPEGHDYRGFSGGIGTLDAYKIAHKDTSYPYYPGPREMSQDHCNWLLMGLATLVKVIPDDLVVSGKLADGSLQTINVDWEARKIIDRIVTWLYWPKGILADEYGVESIVWNWGNVESYGLTGSLWTIINPIIHRCVKGVDWAEILEKNLQNEDDLTMTHYCDGGGAVAKVYAFGYKSIIDMYGTQGISTSSWAGIQTSKLAYLKSVPYDHMKAVQVALFAPEGSLFDNYHDHQTLADYSWGLDDFKYLDALYSVLHDDWHRVDNQYYATYFNSASCPQFVAPLAVNGTAILPHLVFMFTHNLYRILNGMPYTRVRSFEDHTIYPKEGSSSVIGGYYISGNNPVPAYRKTALSLTEIKSTSFLKAFVPDPSEVGPDPNQAKYNADVEYIAGKNVKLLPGFKVMDGAHFLAHIEEMEVYCEFAQATASTSKSLVFIGYTSNDEDIVDSKEKQFETKSGMSETPNESTDESEKESNNGMVIYPNPSNGRITICLSGESTSGELNVLNSLGIEIYSVKLSHPCTSVNLDVPQGIYVCIVKSGSESFIENVVVR